MIRNLQQKSHLKTIQDCTQVRNHLNVTFVRKGSLKVAKFGLTSDQFIKAYDKKSNGRNIHAIFAKATGSHRFMTDLLTISSTYMLKMR